MATELPGRYIYIYTHTHTHTQYIHTYIHPCAPCSVTISVSVCLNSKDVPFSVGDFWQKSVLLCGNGDDSEVDESVLSGSDCNAAEWTPFI